MTQALPPLGIILDDVSLELAGRVVFSGINLQFEPLQWHCLLGRSGVGKSSLLRIISGLQTPSSGQVVSDRGHGLFDQVAYMSQDDGLLPWLSVLDNVRLGPRLREKRHREFRQPALEMLDKVGLLDWADVLPSRLSGGMRQRVALARTLLEECAVVLMDEPFSRLDAITRRELQELAVDLLAQRTVLLVTHDPHEALRVGHTLTVLNPTLPGCVSTQVLPGNPLREYDDPSLINVLPTIWRLLDAEPVHRS